MLTYDDGDVDVGSLLDGLGIGARVGDDDQARLLERTGDVVGEVTGGETSSNGDGTSVCGELEDGTLAVGTGRDDANCTPSSATNSCGIFSRIRLSASRIARQNILSAGLSMATMIRAARTIFSQVLPTLITLTPSGLVFHRYGSMCTWRFFAPRWH
jgi:hypothetical protein